MQNALNKACLIVRHNLRDFLIVTPFLNIIILPFAVTIHWITGSYGYTIGLFLVALGSFMSYLICIWLRSKKLELGAIIPYLLSTVVFVLIWYDFKFLFLVIINDGFILCPFGASCP